jgi:hypothetical protein
MKKTAFLTIASNNYSAFAKTLLQSVSEHHEDASLFYFVTDRSLNEVNYDFGLKIQIKFVEEILGPDVLRMAFKYSLIEFNTAVKPFLIRHLLNLGYEKVVYLDPDIFVYRPLELALESLDSHSVVVTPHQLVPESNPGNNLTMPKWESAALTTGTFNLGFIGVSNSEEGHAFVKWWESRCRLHCIDDRCAGLFVDQKWVDLAPCFFEGLHILRHAGYNFSVWNLHSREFSAGYVNGQFPLVFYHFSSLVMKDDDLISEHDCSLDFQLRDELKQLFLSYKSRLKSNGWDVTKNLPYAYSYFSDGHTISFMHRIAYLNVEDSVGNPFQLEGKSFFKTTREIYRQSNGKNSNKLSPHKKLACLFLKLTLSVLGSEKYTKLIAGLQPLFRFRSHVHLFR